MEKWRLERIFQKPLDFWRATTRKKECTYSISIYATELEPVIGSRRSGQIWDYYKEKFQPECLWNKDVTVPGDRSNKEAEPALHGRGSHSAGVIGVVVLKFLFPSGSPDSITLPAWWPLANHFSSWVSMSSCQMAGWWPWSLDILGVSCLQITVYFPTCHLLKERFTKKQRASFTK